MIQIDLTSGTYVCPFCGCTQAYRNSYDAVKTGFKRDISPIPEEYKESAYTIYSLQCTSWKCKRVAVTAINRANGKRVDIVPQVVYKHYPDYIPQQIRNDYEEANLILESSPKAAATLLRRCLQGMIHDYWGIYEKNLNAEITALRDKVTQAQWTALDGLRKMGNIGAHMEQDVNLIIDIDSDEARKLMRLIETLIDKWYIARHEEEQLFMDITAISDQKEAQRKEHDS